MIESCSPLALSFQQACPRQSLATVDEVVRISPTPSTTTFPIPADRLRFTPLCLRRQIYTDTPCPVPLDTSCVLFLVSAGPGAHGQAQHPRGKPEPRPPFRSHGRTPGGDGHQSAAPRGGPVRASSGVRRRGTRARLHRGALRRLDGGLGIDDGGDRRAGEFFGLFGVMLVERFLWGCSRWWRRCYGVPLW